MKKLLGFDANNKEVFEGDYVKVIEQEGTWQQLYKVFHSRLA